MEGVLAAGGGVRGHAFRRTAKLALALPMSLQWKRKRIGSEGIRKGVRVWALLKGE